VSCYNSYVLGIDPIGFLFRLITKLCVALFGLEFLTTLLEALFLLYFDYFAPACTIHNCPIQVELGQSEIKFTTCVVDLPSH